MSDEFHPGQRWISESEPELGLGSVRRVTARTVSIVFRASEETREYARDNAPLRRVRFRVGDTIKSHDDAVMFVDSVIERAGLIVYRGGGQELCETDLSDAISFNKPEERLLAGQVDPPEVFDLRVAALKQQHRRRQSKVRGFVGGRIDLIPHQLYIAAEVAGRLVPRVLLADEVGLGKTIEACLILHRLILTGRAQRVLILLPESLVHQWFVELLRRFNLWFHIFDEERCEAIEAATPEANPFLDDQLVLCSLSLITGNEQRVQQALAAGWDMLVVDEAHHLGWSPEAVSREYAVVEALGRQTSGLLLLTATPEQLGMASHFARLRLLDPDRFYDLNEFINEAGHYREVARLAEKIHARTSETQMGSIGDPPVPSGDSPLARESGGKSSKPVEGRKRPVISSGQWPDDTGESPVLPGKMETSAPAKPLFAANDIKTLSRILADTTESVQAKLEKIAEGDSGARDELMDALLDQHGTGRVMFRNTRATISGFPPRKARMCPMDAPVDSADLFDALADEFAADVVSNPGRRRGNETQTKTISKTPHVVSYSLDNDATDTVSDTFASFQPEFSNDPRIGWLADLLRALGQEKVLLICRTQVKATAIDAALRQRINVKMAVFHEGLSLVQRDRNAAWFAEDNGARLLICSEIGSEGRNFQFAHHLVLFDLPLDPDLLEQRIGRLDRIGQSSEILVHVPFVTGSSQEVLARWYQEGLNAFEKNLIGGRELLASFGARVHDLAQDFHETEETSRAELDRLIEETRAARKEITFRLEQGRDRLLELNSFRASTAVRLVGDIQSQDDDRSLDDFMISVFDHYTIHLEELAERTYQLGSAGVFADVFPGLPAEGLTVTCDRSRALAREDIQFLTWDHPLVTGAIDLLLGSEKGNSSFAVWPDGGAAGLYLEAIYLLECIAPPHLHVDRFLPPTPLRVLLDHRGNDTGRAITPEMLARCLKGGEAYTLLDRPELREELLPNLLERAQGIASSHVQGIVSQARKAMIAQLEHETARLRELQKVNRSVRAEEIALLVEQQSALDRHLIGARLRLDAIRLIQRGGPTSGP
jgi:ATP-dependent helicase HepA